MKKIKRYANRKLYDTNQSCYVTLEDIGQMIRAGEEVEVIDNKSGEDLTQVTLAQIIFETEKRRSFMPLALLRKLIQGGGDALGELARDGVDRVQATAHQVKHTAQKLRDNLGGRIERVRRRGDQDGEFAEIFAEARRCLAELEARGVGHSQAMAQAADNADDMPQPAAQPHGPTDAPAHELAHEQLQAAAEALEQPSARSAQASVAELRRRLGQLEGLLVPAAEA